MLFRSVHKRYSIVHVQELQGFIFFRSLEAIFDQLPKTRFQERKKLAQLDLRRRYDSIMTAAIHEINHNDKLTIDGCCNILVI